MAADREPLPIFPAVKPRRTGGPSNEVGGARHFKGQRRTSALALGWNTHLTPCDVLSIA